MPDRFPIARMASLFVLLAIICAVGFVFLRVMSGFWLPLFLAALLVVIFAPVHQWILDACEGKQKRAAILTTLAILLAVLGPLVWVSIIAVDEAQGLLTRNWANEVSDIETRASGLRTRVKLDMPYTRKADDEPKKDQPLVDLEESFEQLLSQHDNDMTEYGVAACKQLVRQTKSLIDKLQVYVVDDLEKQLASGTSKNGKKPPDSDFLRRVYLDLTGQPPTTDENRSFREDLSVDKRSRLIDRLIGNSHFQSLKQQIDEAHQPIFDKRAEQNVSVAEAHECRQRLEKAGLSFRRIKQRLLGGPLRAWLIGLANPSAAQLQSWQGSALGYLRQAVVSLTGQTTALVGSLLFGLFILIISLYYFLVDGPSMIRAAMRLSPLDDKYEAELFAEFANMSRAVVLATLLSAAAQALLAGVGYAVVGARPLFLLTVVTGLLAMVPFVGAAAVWLPVALWVGFVDQAAGAEDAGRLIPGVGLAIYGVVVVSMADNLIKPWVLHGQSNLHPLLALLSVLGGVKALGPVGLLVGPMIVSFLQALLTMLNTELGRDASPAGDVETVPRKLRKKTAG